MFNSFAKLKLLKPYLRTTFTTSCDAAAAVDEEEAPSIIEEVCGAHAELIRFLFFVSLFLPCSSLLPPRFTHVQADALINANKLKLKTPRQFSDQGMTLGKANVNTYDGFRLVVQKQVNLNTVVSHL